MNGEFPYQPPYPMGGTDGEPEPRGNEPEQTFFCPKCGKAMGIVEVVSMGPGYNEWEDLTPILRCQCGHEEKMRNG